MVTAEKPRPVAVRETMHKIHSMKYTRCGIALESASATYSVTSFWGATTCADCRHALSESLEDAAEHFEYVIDHDPGGVVELILEAAAALARDPFDAQPPPPTISASG